MIHRIYDIISIHIIYIFISIHSICLWSFSLTLEQFRGDWCCPERWGATRFSQKPRSSNGISTISEMYWIFQGNNLKCNFKKNTFHPDCVLFSRKLMRLASLAQVIGGSVFDHEILGAYLLNMDIVLAGPTVQKRATAICMFLQLSSCLQSEDVHTDVCVRIHIFRISQWTNIF